MIGVSAEGGLPVVPAWRATAVEAFNTGRGCSPQSPGRRGRNTSPRWRWGWAGEGCLVACRWGGVPPVVPGDATRPCPLPVVFRPFIARRGCRVPSPPQ